MATLSKATQQLSSDAKSKMLSVVGTSITCAKVNKQQVTADEATRLWAVVAAGNGVKTAAKSTTAAASGSGRHLLAEPQSTALQQPQQVKPHCKEPQQEPLTNSSSSSYWDGSNDSRYQLFGPTPQAPRALLEAASTVYTPPAFLASAQEIATLLASAASPGTGFLSGGESGLYVSVANQLGRNYAGGTGVAVGPKLTGTGGGADASSASNALVSFSKPLTGSCVAEDGSVDASKQCR